LAGPLRAPCGEYSSSFFFFFFFFFLLFFSALDASSAC
jgi:hypothetical protein